MELEEEIYFKNLQDKLQDKEDKFNSYINLSLIDNIIEPNNINQDFLLWTNLQKFKNYHKPINNINVIPDFIDNPKRKTSKNNKKIDK